MRFCTSSEMVSIGAEQKESPVCTPSGIDVLNEAHGDHVVLRVAHDLELELLPAEDRLLHEHLAHKAGLQAAGAHGAQLVHVVDEGRPPAPPIV